MDESTGDHINDDEDAPVPAGDHEPEATTLLLSPSAADAGARLDAFLAAHVEGVSRTRLKQSIEDGDVLVSGRAAKPSYKLRAGDEVELEMPAPPASNFTPEDIPLSVVFEDDSLIVIDKPAGLVVHPAAGVSSGTLANALAFHFTQLSAHAGALRPGIVHRLDRDTSGLMVVAKSESAHEHLSDQFRAREVFKSYVALVHGRVREESGRIEEPLARDPR
ncbi:MAG TPA: RluA family pseudouridine synthase, partial [Pyrinomonadaceae bacterium]